MKYIEDESIVLTLSELDRILGVIPANKIISIFAPDEVTVKEWMKLDHASLRRTLFNFFRKHGAMQRDIII